MSNPILISQNILNISNISKHFKMSTNPIFLCRQLWPRWSVFASHNTSALQSANQWRSGLVEFDQGNCSFLPRSLLRIGLKQHTDPIPCQCFLVLDIDSGWESGQGSWHRRWSFSDFDICTGEWIESVNRCCCTCIPWAGGEGSGLLLDLLWLANHSSCCPLGSLRTLSWKTLP